MLGFLKMSDQEKEQQHALREELKKKGKGWSILDVEKARARKAENVHSRHDKEGVRQRKSIKSKMTICPQVHLEKKIVLRVSTAQMKEIVVMIESVIVGISCIASTSRKINVT